MKTDLPADESKLRELLRTWEVAPRQDPALARKVWARLETTSALSPARWLTRYARILARPVSALVTIILFGALGAVAADAQRDHRRDVEVARLAAEYARTIDPILMTGATDHTGHSP